MRLLAFIAICFFSTSAFGQSQAELKKQITSLKATQKAEYDQVLKDLKGSRDYAAGLYTDLEKAQAQINQVGAERDGWKSYGEAEHDGRINAEKRVAEEKVKKQRWVMIASAVSVLMLTYLGLKFFTPLRAIL